MTTKKVVNFFEQERCIPSENPVYAYGTSYDRPRGGIINALYLEVDAIGVDEVVFGSDDAYLRVAKFTDISVQDAYLETSDEVIADARLGRVRLRLTQ